MNKPWQQLLPKEKCQVRLEKKLTDLDQELLTFLYQPIVGPNAFSLFMTLWGECRQHNQKDLQHAELLNNLSLDIPQLYQARLRLEGIGLLKTYVDENVEERRFLYILQQPLEAKAFFEDDLLSLLLIETVGERKFDKLGNYFGRPSTDMTSYQEITRSFLDVFQFNPNHLQTQKRLLEKSKAKFPVEGRPSQLLENSAFNWQYFVESLDSLLVKKDQNLMDLRETILALHHLYGLDELEMKEFVTQAADYVTGTIKKEELKRIVRLSYHQRQPQKVVPKDVVQMELLNETEQKQLRNNTLLRSGFSKEEITIIQMAESIPPMFFLQSIKEQKGGFVAREETWLVENLIQSSGLPNSVLNILIHYILAVKNNASLTANFMNPIANDWAQSKIYSPEDAMKKVKELASRRAKQGSTSRKKWTPASANTIRKESLPAWVDQEQKEEKQLSEDEEKYFSERIKNLTEQGKRGEG